MSSSTQASALRQTAQVMRSPSVDETSIRFLRGRIDELVEENRQLREALQPEENSIFWQLDGLSPAQRVMMQKLSKSPVVTRESLTDAIAACNKTEITNPQTLNVLVSRLRKKLKGTKYSVEPVWGIGYRLEVAE